MEKARTHWLRDPSTGGLYEPVKMVRREDRSSGFRILDVGSNNAADDIITDSEAEVIAALRRGLRVRCIGPDGKRGGYAIGGKLGLELVIHSPSWRQGRL